MNDTVMKAHQNRDMTYDEMNDYEIVNEARVSCVSVSLFSPTQH